PMVFRSAVVLFGASAAVGNRLNSGAGGFYTPHLWGASGARTTAQWGLEVMIRNRTRLLASTTLVAASLLAASAAQPHCPPDAPASGTTVTCSGVDTDGFAAGAASSLTLNVLAGASVTGGAVVISLNGSNVVSNAGAITAGTNQVGLQALSNNVITNLGTLAVG